MNQSRLSYYNAAIFGSTLFLTLFLIQRVQSSNLAFIYGLLFLVFNLSKDAVFHKLGFTFQGFGFKKMLYLQIIMLVLFIIWFLIMFK